MSPNISAVNFQIYNYLIRLKKKIMLYFIILLLILIIFVLILSNNNFHNNAKDNNTPHRTLLEPSTKLIAFI